MKGDLPHTSEHTKHIRLNLDVRQWDENEVFFGANHSRFACAKEILHPLLGYLLDLIVQALKELLGMKLNSARILIHTLASSLNATGTLIIST